MGGALGQGTRGWWWRQWLRAAEVAVQGTGDGGAGATVMAGVGSCRDGGSGRKQGRWRRALRRLGREEDEVNLKKPSPPSFYKLLSSRTVTCQISL